MTSRYLSTDSATVDDVAGYLVVAVVLVSARQRELRDGRVERIGGDLGAVLKGYVTARPSGRVPTYAGGQPSHTRPRGRCNQGQQVLRVWMRSR
jgi:hypothetical protein